MSTKNEMKSVISALKKGDEEAFKYVYDTNIRSLTSLVNTLTQNKSQTEDILQDTFIKLWEIKGTLNTDVSISGFLYKIAYNNFIDKYRKKQVERRALDHLLYRHIIELKPEDQDRTNQRIKQLKSSIEKLPPKCKEVFILNKFDNLKYTEIADLLNISIKTVESQIRTAFIKIRADEKSTNFINLFINFKYKIALKFHI